MALKSGNARCWQGNEKHDSSYISVVNEMLWLFWKILRQLKKKKNVQLT